MLILIIGVDVNFIYHLKEILKTLLSGHKIARVKFSVYATKTAELYVEFYPWHPMTILHKIPMHI